MRKIQMLFLATLAFCMVAVNTAKTQNTATGKTQVKWLTWEDAMEKHESGKRKIMLDVYTDWCGWCKKMDAVTFQQEEIAQYLNEHFYLVRLNAEEKQDLEYRHKVFRYVKNGQRGYHELAAELLRGRLSFPTVVFLDEELNVIQAIVGFKTPEQFGPIAQYFAADYYKTKPWSSFQKEYKGLK